MNTIIITYLGFILAGIVLFPIGERLWAKHLEIREKLQMETDKDDDELTNSYETMRVLATSNFKNAILFIFMVAPLIVIPLIMSIVTMGIVNREYSKDMKK